MKTTYITYFLCVALLMGMIGCGDNGTGSDPEEAPSVPEIQNEEAQPDISFFQDNQPTADTSSYSAAYSTVVSTSSIFAITANYSAFLSPATSEEPDLEDGQWVWNYTYSREGVSGEFRLIAEEVADGHQWELFLSSDDGEGNNFENYKIMEGTTSTDGSEGSWAFNALNDETGEEAVAFITSWVITSDTEKELSFEGYEEGSVDIEGQYLENQPEHTFTINYSEGETVEVFWNSETNEGYIDQGEERRCWDENFEYTSCS